MPKTNSTSKSAEACGVGVPAEPPVDGVSFELGTLLVQAVKARRKFLSKSSSSAEASTTDDGDGEKDSLRRSSLEKLQNAADDKTTAFLNELRRQVEQSAHASKKSSSSRRSKTSDAPSHCLEFLLGVLSDGSNSFHLRRSALSLSREVLDRSSDARAYLAGGRRLLDFVSVVEAVENDHVGEDEDRNDAPINDMSPNAMFQLEAMELIHHLAAKFGRFYTQFTVASRLLGDVSVNFSMHNTSPDPNNSDAHHANGRNNRSQRNNMRILRRERDIALERGPKACQSLERMVERADEYFRVLVPRFGGFAAELSDEPSQHESIIEDMKQGCTPGSAGDVDDDDNDDDSIDWEEGDIDLSEHDYDGSVENTSQMSTGAQGDTDRMNAPLIDHQTAVTHTLDIMGRSGALLDGKLAVQIGGKKSTETGTTLPGHAEATRADETTVDPKTEARIKLQNLVQKLSARRLPRLNQWIHALSRADGMEERAVVDPATSGTAGNEGPVSLVLLSEEKRAMRGQLLQRMMKFRGEIQGVLKAAATLGITPEEAVQKREENTRSAGRTLENDDREPSANAPGFNTATSLKREWMPGVESWAVGSKRKKPKSSRFKVIYRKKS